MQSNKFNQSSINLQHTQQSQYYQNSTSKQYHNKYTVKTYTTNTNTLKKSKSKYKQKYQQKNNKMQNSIISIQDRDSDCIGDNKYNSTYSYGNTKNTNKNINNVYINKSSQNYTNSRYPYQNRQYNKSIDIQQNTDIQQIISIPDKINLAQQQIDKLTQLVTSLVIKNKINSKNAFEIPLIDVTSIGAIKNNDDNSWNKISNVLENSSKVYGFRVDFVVDCINKMTNNMLRSQKTQQITTINIDKFIKNNKQVVKQPSNNNISQCEYQNTNIYTSINKSIQQLQNKQQLFSNNLQKRQKINQQICEFRNDTNYQNIRRMFDQNGINGLLVARLPITKKLNLVVDPNIEYQNVKEQEKMDNYLVNQIMLQKKQRYMTKFTVFQQINSFKHFCLDKDNKNNGKQQIVEECYNLYFDDIPEIFRDCYQQNENDGRDQFIMETFRNQDQFGNIGYQNNQMLNNEENKLQKIQINNNINNLNSHDMLSNYNIFTQPLNQSINKQAKKNNIKKKQNEQNKKQKKRAKLKLKRQDHHINFKAQLEENNTSSILSITDKKLDKQNVRKTKQKNILKNLGWSFQIQKQLKTIPLPQINNNQLNKTNISEQNKQYNQLLNSYNKPDFSQNQYSDLLTQIGSYQKSILIKMPNIKQTKNWLWQHIRSQNQIYLSKLHQLYEKQKGTVSQAIIFLSVLHLGNQKNLQISQSSNWEIKIKNYNTTNQLTHFTQIN